MYITLPKLFIVKYYLFDPHEEMIGLKETLTLGGKPTRTVLVYCHTLIFRHSELDTVDNNISTYETGYC